MSNEIDKSHIEIANSLFCCKLGRALPDFCFPKKLLIILEIWCVFLWFRIYLFLALCYKCVSFYNMSAMPITPNFTTNSKANFYIGGLGECIKMRFSLKHIEIMFSAKLWITIFADLLRTLLSIGFSIPSKWFLVMPPSAHDKYVPKTYFRLPSQK